MKSFKKLIFLSLILSFLLPMTVFADTPPTINGKEAIVMDIKTGEIIYGKNIDDKVYPASTTKLMTALLLAENNQKSDNLKYTDSAKKQPQYSINTNFKTMKIGETMTADDVMKALMLYSANDIAYMIADNVGGTSDKFIQMMNDKAKKLGLIGTNFTSPNGLHDDAHYTTPYELSIIGLEAYKSPWVREVMGLKTATITTSDNRPIMIENRNKLLGIDGCTGGKTGYTSQAGRCLVAFFNRDGRELVGVVTKSLYVDDLDTYVFDDMKKIIDYGYSLKKSTLYTKDQEIKNIDVSYKPLRFFGFSKTVSIPVLIKSDALYYENEISKKEMKEVINIGSINIWKLKSDATIGTLSLNIKNSSSKYDLYTTVSKGTILKDNILIYAGIFLILIFLLIIVFVVLHNVRRGSRRKNYY